MPARIMLASWYTGGLYVLEFERLCKSVHRLPVADQPDIFKFKRVDDYGSWIENVRQKPRHCASMLDDAQRLGADGLVVVDADCVLWRWDFDYWSCLVDLRVDVCMRRKSEIEVLTGTIFLRVCPAAREFCMKWHLLTLSLPGVTEQKCLSDFWSQLSNMPGLILRDDMPAAQCAIFDERPAVVEPAIEHLQASRERGAPTIARARRLLRLKVLEGMLSRSASTTCDRIWPT